MSEKTVEEILKKCGGYNNESAHEIIGLRIAGCSKERRDVNWEFITISWPSYIWENLDKFEWKLNTDIALALLHHGQYQAVFSFLNKFEDVKEIIHWSVYLCPNVFRDIASKPNNFWFSNQELAEMLIDMKYWIQLIENMPKLKWLDYKKIFDLLLEKNPRALWQAICYWGMENFVWINWDMYDDRIILYKLLEKNNPIICRWIWENLNKFFDLKKEDYNNIAMKLIEFGSWKYVVENICKFKWLEWKVADELVKQWFFDKMVHNKMYGKLWKNKKFIWWWFKNRKPDTDTVNLLFENNYWNMVWKNLLVFKKLKIDKIFALKLVESWWWDAIFNWEINQKFKKLSKEDREEILQNALCVKWKILWEDVSFWYEFYQMMKWFSESEIKELLAKMMSVKNEILVAKVLMFLKFDLSKNLLFKLLESGEKIWKYVLDSFDKFEKLSDEEIEKIKDLLIKNWENDVILEYRKELK